MGNPSDHRKAGAKFQELLAIMARLRAENGCPWDRQQTHKSLRQYLLEETFEVLESLDEENYSELPGELGDLLLQIIFHAQIGSENNVFTIEDVIENISEKLIRRHPNVFGDLDIKNAEEQSVNWERIKKTEGKTSVIDGVPKALSALLRATRIQQKASTVGFDWPEPAPVWDKVAEELAELKEVCQEQNQDRIEEEFGDLLFALVNLSRFLRVNAEDALRRTTEKFISRFQSVEDEFKKQNKSMHEASLAELDAVWEAVKTREKQA